MSWRRLTPATGVCLLLLLCACPDETVVIPPTACSFSGITAVDADGDTLSIDPEDWCPGPAAADTLQPWLSSFGPAYPNPSSGRTSIRFSLGGSGQVRIILISADCAIVRTLVSATLAAGLHVVEWDGLDDAGHLLASGIYRCQMTATSFTCHGDIEIRR